MLPARPRLPGLIALFAGGLFLLRLLFQADAFPPFLGQEESELLRNLRFLFATAEYHDSWLKALWQTSGEYNKGYVYFLAPFYAVWGDRAELIWAGNSVIAAVLATFWARLYLQANPERRHWAPWIWAATLTVWVVCVRRSKWHPVSQLGVASLWLFFRPAWQSGLSELAVRWSRIVGLSLYAFSVFLYFGNLQYLPLLFGFHLWFASPAERAAQLRLGLLFAAIGVAVNAYVWRSNSVWQFDVQHSLQRFARLIEPAAWAQIGTSVLSFGRAFYTWPGLLVSAFGALIFVGRALRGDRFAQLVLGFLTWSLGLQALMWGFDYADCLNWSLVSLTLLLVVGADELLARLRSIHTGLGYAGVLLVLLAAGAEFRAYPEKHDRIPGQDTADPWNTATQFALLLQRLSSSHLAEQRSIWLPAPGTPAEAGGFDTKYGLETRNAREALSRVQLFNDPASLAAQIRAGAPHTEWEVYLAAPSERALTETLLGVPPEPIALGAETYARPVWVRRYRFSGGADAALARTP